MHHPQLSAGAAPGAGKPTGQCGRKGRVTCLALLGLAAGHAGPVLATPVEILGTTYYMNSLGWSLYKWLYIPVSFLVVLFIYWLLLRHIPRRWLKIGLVVTLQLVLAILPLWNVYQIGQAAKPYCADAGLKVYKTVQAAGFWGGSSIAYWSKYGFEYVESSGSGRYSIWTLVDGKKHHEYRDKLTSRYALHSRTHEPVGRTIVRSRFWMQDEQTGDVLGELVTYGIRPGWWDRLVVGGTLGDVPGWGCGDDVPEELRPVYGKQYGLIDLIKATIKPLNGKGVGQ